MEFETKPPEDCVDRAGVAPEDNTGGNHILIDNDVVKLRNKVANGDALVSLDPPLRDSIPIHDLGSPSKFRPASTCSKKNTRRRMEDRHVVLHDLKAYLPSHLQSKISQQEHVSFYAVYDGHAGARAAIFAAAHLHEKLVESPDFHTDPVNAIKEAITNTDQLICESAADQSHGATIVLNLIKDRVLYSAWLGDSQSILARNGEYIKLVDPHSPKRWDEKERIQKLGGYVNFWGTWRVNGTLAVSRALGDFALKPYVSSDCDVTTVHLTDLDDFIIVACDGLWDGISPEEGVQMVYDFIKEEKNHDQLDELSSMLSKEAMDKGSTDNITTIVVFLRPLADIRQDCLRERPAMVDPREGIVSTSDFIQNPGTTRDSLDPAQHQPQWASEAASPVTSSQPQITPKHPLVQQFCENSGGGMFSPDPFSTIQQLDTSDQEQFGQTTLEDLRPSPSINSEDSTDYGSTCLDRDSPNKGDSGFISPKKEGGLMSHSSIAAVDQLFKLMNTADQDDDSPPPGEEKSLEEILAERRLIKEDNNIQDESDEDEDEDDDNEDEDVDAVSAVEDDSEDSDDFDKVAVQLSIVEPGDALEVDLSVMTIRDGGYVEDQIEMDPCEQVVVKETHPEESGCLVPPLSTLPTSQASVPASSKGSSDGSEEGATGCLKIKTVIHSLLETCASNESEVRQAAAHSLSLVGKQFPLLVLQEWYAAYTRTKQSPLNSPAARRSPSVASPRSPPHLLTAALQPLVTVLMKHSSLDPGDVSHRAVLGQIMAQVVEEMIQGVSKEVQYETILVDLAGSYMDKVMDVLLVHYHPSNLGSPINPVVVETLATLAYHHPHLCVPFIKAILSTTAHVMKGTKHGDVLMKTVVCTAICRFSEAILDYVSNIHEMPDTSVTLGHYHPEGDAIYDILYSSWLPTTKENKIKIQILESMAACTPFLSKENILDRGAAMLASLLSLYKKLGSSANLEITLSISQLVNAITSISPNILDHVLESVQHAMFIQVCIVPDYLKPSTVKNHHEVIRTYDILMKFYPEKVVSGLLQKFDSHDERSRVGALTVIKHLLNLPTKTLNYRLEEISKTMHANLGEQNGNVKRLMAQIILVLGHHGCLSGEMSKDFIDFLVKMCADPERSNNAGSESMSVLGDSILQLLTNTVSGVESVLWPYLLEYLLQEEFTHAVPAVTKALAVLSKRKQATEDADFTVSFPNLQFCSSPMTLFSRLMVLASNPQVDKRGTHILNFLKSFVSNIHPSLKELWDSRFPLLLHYLELHESVENYQWHSWLLDLLSDSLRKIQEEEWSRKMTVCLVHQFSMYANSSVEKAFSIRSVGYVLDTVINSQVVMDNLSSLFLAALESDTLEESCAKAFGMTSRNHLPLVMNKLETLYKTQVAKKKTNSFFSMFHKSGEENHNRSLCIILCSLGQAAKHSPTEELEKVADKIVKEFLSPSILNCKSSEKIQESVLTAISEVTIAFHKVLKENAGFQMPQQEQLLAAIISLLQDNLVSLTSKQMALISMTNLIQLPPTISQLTRCAMLKASFNTLFNSFLEADCSKHEDYAVARDLELKLTSIADSLHILIKELLMQDMEQSTVDEIFTMLETWLRLDLPLSRELSVNIFQGALEVYSKHVKLGVGSPTNFTPGPFMIGSIVARCHDPSMSVRRTALGCLKYLLRILGVYEGLAPETVESSVEQLYALDTRCNNIEMTAKLDQPAISETLLNVLNERMQHHHILTLLDSLADGLLDSQVSSVAGCIAVFEGIVNVRGSEVYQNIPGLASKLHFKMSMMIIDESSDLMSRVALNVRHLAVHNSRGVVSSLLRSELPFDRAAKMIWAALADGSKISADVIDLLLEFGGDQPVRQTVHGTYAADVVAVASISALTIMLDTRRLEVLCRQEFGKLFSHMVVIASHFVNARFDRKKSEVGGGPVSISPFICSLEAFRSLFSSINCLVVSHVITTDHTIADLGVLRSILGNVMKATVVHAQYLLQLIVSALLPLSNGHFPECVRETGVSLLAGIALEKVGGDMVLLANIVTALLKIISDPSGKVREFVLEGLAALEFCSLSDIDTLTEGAISAFILGLEDEKSASVSLTALRGLCRTLPILPAHFVHNFMDLISLKVRPYLEMSGNEHRAEAISVYGQLGRFADDNFRTVYLDQCQSILGPVLLYTTSSHKETSTASLRTLEAVLGAAGDVQLAQEVAKYNIHRGFEHLMVRVVDGCGEDIDDMLHSLVGQCIGYFRSSNPGLRKNAVILLSKVLCKTSSRQDTSKGTDEELFAGVLGGTLDLLKDPDIEVRKTAALYIGDLITMQCSQNP